MTDARRLATLADDLGALYHELHRALEHPTRAVREARIMRPKPGPSTPAPVWLLSIDEELTGRLLEVTSDAARQLGDRILFPRDGRAMCRWLSRNAEEVAALDFADDLVDELDGQHSDLTKHLRPEPISDDTWQRMKAANRRYTAAEAARIVTKTTGETIDRKRITTWANRGHIPYETEADGTRSYELPPILARITGDAQPAPLA